jgi:hypothetical protein
MRLKWYLSLWYFWRKPSTYVAPTLKTYRNEIPHDPRDLGVPSGASNTISEPMVCSTQTMHQSCTDTKTFSKWTKTRFHTAHVIYEFYRVRPKLFMSLWYVQCKLCTYLASWVALSSNGPNRGPRDPRHIGVPSGASKTTYEPMVLLTQTELLSCTDAKNISKRDSTWPTWPRRSIECLQYYFWAYVTFDANHAPILHQE